MSFPRESLLSLAALLVFASLPGCGKPNRANIDLRRQNEELRSQLAAAQRERDVARAESQGLRAQQPGVPTLPADRLAKLFTTHGIEIGRLTGAADLDPAKPGVDGLKVYVTPQDAAGQKLKAAGSFVVEAFDLAAEGENRVGRWTFDVSRAAELWNGTLTRYEYVLPCPWEKPPAHADVTVKVTFVDELTSRTFTQQKPVTVQTAAK